MSVLLSVESVSKRYPGRTGRAPVSALEDVSLSIRRGQSFGLVGESGSGKTTLSRLILQLEPPSEGRIVYDGADLAGLAPQELRRLRSRIQIVFQDPYASLNPRLRIGDIISEGPRAHGLIPGGDRKSYAAQWLARVGLDRFGEGLGAVDVQADALSVDRRPQVLQCRLTRIHRIAAGTEQLLEDSPADPCFGNCRCPVQRSAQ